MELSDFRFIYHKIGGHNVIFEAANQDLTDTEYQYYGFLSNGGAWIIQRFHIIAGAVIYEYAAGAEIISYLINWDGNGRYTGTLTFYRYDQIAAV